MLQKFRLNLTNLEDRDQPVTFGIPWADSNLSVSFAPDGTAIAGRSSDLYAGLNADRSENEWQLDILRAFYAWTSHTNIDISVVPDSGAAFGTAGRSQNDPRFGDIRIGGNRLAPNVLAVASPPDPALAGTLAGDVFINTNYSFNSNPYDLHRVMLHEAGHALGLDHSTNPQSPMFPRFNNTVGELTPGDISAIRQLYGHRVVDSYEGATGNGTFANARAVPRPSNYTGQTPLLAFADLSNADDVDLFWFDSISSEHNENVTVRVQSSGLSLLGAKVSVYFLDENGNPNEVANVKSDAADYMGDTLELSFDGNGDDDQSSRRYYIRVEKGEDVPFVTGRYAVAVSYDGHNTVPESHLNEIILGSYQQASPDDLAALLQNPTGAWVNVDLGTNETRLQATTLTPSVDHGGRLRYDAIGSIGSVTDLDFYRVVAPGGSTPRVLTVNVWTLPGHTVDPRIALVDSTGNTLPAAVLVNDNGVFTIQAKNIQPGATYFVRVRSANSATGNYFLTADFGTTATKIEQLTSGTLGSSARTDTLHVATPQLFHFILSSNATGAPSGSQIRLTVIDDQGQIVFDRSGRVGESVTGPSVLLRPGQYSVRLQTIGTDGIPIEFAIRGNRLTDPIGPIVEDPTLDPQYQSSQNPNEYTYPGVITSVIPYFWELDPLTPILVLPDYYSLDTDPLGPNRIGQ